MPRDQIQPGFFSWKREEPGIEVDLFCVAMFLCSLPLIF